MCLPLIGRYVEQQQADSIAPPKCPTKLENSFRVEMDWRFHGCSSDRLRLSSMGAKRGPPESGQQVTADRMMSTDFTVLLRATATEAMTPCIASPGAIDSRNGPLR